MSCDLVGSTHFKQTEEGWQKVFLTFYREFTQFVARVNRSVPDDEATEFHLWKSVGDELIYEVEVKSEKGIARAVRVWIQAMTEYEEQSLAESNLALKGGAFVATFPGPDSESTIPRNPDVEISDEPVVILNQKALTGTRAYRKYLYDYFGPSIDTGFRLYSLATRRYFTLSVEVAWTLAAAAHEAVGTNQDTDRFHVHDVVFQGTHGLKGVWDGREYPVFAIDREHSDAVHEAIARLDGEGLDADRIMSVCRACSETPNWPFKLYLPAAANTFFHTGPANAMKKLLDAESPLDGAESPASADGGEALGDEAPLGDEKVTDEVEQPSAAEAAGA